MARFIGLEGYLQPQNLRGILKVIADTNESTVPANTANDRLSDFAEAALKTTWLEAEALKKGGLTTVDARDTSKLSIRERAKFFEENSEENLIKRQKALNDKVIRIRKWLSRQGVTFKGNYEIDHRKLMNKLVKYDNDPTLQNATKAKLIGGKFYDQNNQLLDTGKMVTHHSGPGYAIYVLSGQGNFHIASHKVGQYHHSSLLGGAKVACGGEMKITQGRLEFLSNKSGHYHPDKDDLLHVLAVLQNKGVNMDFKVNSLKADNSVSKHASVWSFLLSLGLDNLSVEWIRRGMKGAYHVPDLE
jgi:hypothetical protein